ncbi:MAG TPA: hypothetical protein DCL55_16730 [Brevundimonas sp.]|nr:hypothetical protein [Brevundimonas sp.]
MTTRRRLLAALPALSLAACATGRSGGYASGLTVATFNIWHDQGDWPARLPLIEATLRAADAVVIGLQEVLQNGDALPNQARTLADRLGMQMVFSSVDAEDQPRRYGNALLTRLPILDDDSIRLEPLDDYRTAQRIRSRRADGTVIDIANTHFHHTPDGGAIRARQIAHLLDWLPDDGTPLILMGDLNAPLDNPEMAPLRARFSEALWTLHPDQADRTTLNTALGHRSVQIDHILYEAAAFTPVEAAIVGDQPVGEVWPSDHFAKVTRFRTA